METTVFEAILVPASNVSLDGTVLSARRSVKGVKIYVKNTQGDVNSVSLDISQMNVIDHVH